ncbi:MAG: GNAT family N-acetyltransferase [Ignavibacteria bacterium]|nr:GNAT family N-acetyltransferase [Ignavibacteria bacterium]MBI3764925.1 GNAT family N-acetyltransferase [Ignavibacteriales bacterium]
MNRVTIRRVKKSDAAVFLSLINALADFEKLKRPTRAARTRLLRDAFGKKKRFDAYLAFVDTKAVGYAIIFETYSSFLARPTLYLEDLFVLPEHRKQHIGLKLFRACFAEAKRRGCGRMEWMVLDWNINAIRFYKHLGAQHLNNWFFYRLEI